MTLPLTSKPIVSPPTFESGIVLDIPVWTCVLARLRKAVERESAVVRWSAINCGPAELPTKCYKLRPRLYARPRQTKLLVSITISDTDREGTIRRTLDSVLLNINCIETETDLNPMVSWKDIVIVFVGSSGTMRPETNGLVGHIYEYTLFPRHWSISKEPRPSLAPCQLMFFDSTTSIGTVRANVWVVRAFAVMLKAQIWVSVQHRNIKRHQLHKIQEHPSASSAYLNKMLKPSRRILATEHMHVG
ncbi:hypothetical protein OIDMADRAFT_32148 [Oidiodendron maius Zn]|uniref:chitin synthase n=1 Tax=Oidiodendron maius (strain Zn) TaxID=913774 RepID=A0A0C3H3V3_OIDMZ|nr:hypothetical protein OIDMADRAFT_32148 [Oidiodendron maius Zn]